MGITCLVLLQATSVWIASEPGRRIFGDPWLRYPERGRGWAVIPPFHGLELLSYSHLHRQSSCMRQETGLAGSDDGPIFSTLDAVPLSDSRSISKRQNPSVYAVIVRVTARETW